MGSLTGASFPTAKKIAASAGKKKISLLFNPSLYLAQKGVTVLKPILRNTTLLIFNKEEAQALLKSYSKSMEEMVKQLPDYGPTTVIITDGPRNVAAWHEHTIYSLVQRLGNKKKGWLAPSIQHKLDSHIKIIQKVEKILPVL